MVLVVHPPGEASCLINENGSATHFLGHLRPGDLVRHQLFEDDASAFGPSPVGLVIWMEGGYVAVLWSSS